MLNRFKSLKLLSVILSVLMIVSLFTTQTVFGAEAPLCGGDLSGGHRSVAKGNGLLSAVLSERCGSNEKEYRCQTNH